MISRRDLFRASAGAVLAFQVDKFGGMASVPMNLDHILLGCNDLDQGIAYLEKLSDSRAGFGGTHPGRGTRNALLKLASNCYLEILAPDPEQKELAWHADLVWLVEPLLVGFALRQANLEQFAKALRQKGIDCLGPIAGSRQRPDGRILRWKTVSYKDDRDGLLPFFIDWDQDSPHPSTDAPGSLTLVSFERTGHILDETTPPAGKHKEFFAAEPVQLRARLRGPRGEFELVSKKIPSEAWTS